MSQDLADHILASGSVPSSTEPGSVRPGPAAVDLAKHNFNPVGKLEWKRYGEARFGLRGSQVMAMIRASDNTYPIKVYDVIYPERMFLTPQAAQEAAEKHTRCDFHGIESCQLCWINVVPSDEEGAH